MSEIKKINKKYTDKYKKGDYTYSGVKRPCSKCSYGTLFSYEYPCSICTHSQK